MEHSNPTCKLFMRMIRVIITCYILFILPATTLSQTEHFNQEVLEESINTLFNAEQAVATNSETVRMRHAELIAVIRQMLHSTCANTVDTIFSNDNERMIQQMYSLNQLDDAAKLIHTGIIKLKDINCVSAAVDLKNRNIPQNPQRQTNIQHHPGAQHHPKSQRNQAENTPQKIEPAQIIASYDIHSIATGSQLANMLKLVNSVIDSSARRLYFTGTKSTSVGVVDLESNTLVDTFDIGRTGGFLILDKIRNNLYLFDIRQRAYYEISLKNKTCKAISGLPPGITMPPNKAAHYIFNGITYNTIDSYPFLARTQQANNGSYTIMEKVSATGEPLGHFQFGPDSLYSILDDTTGLLYCNITGGGAIEVFDLGKDAVLSGRIDVGTSIDQILLHPESGGLFIRNRLGGSTIQYYNPATSIFKEIQNENVVGEKGIGLWPTDMIYTAGKLYVLCHFAGRVDVIDVLTWKIEKSYPLPLSAKPRTHALSNMALDKSNKIVYAAFPELGEIVSVNINNPEESKKITINRFNTSSHGAALLELAVDEKRGHLFAYMANEQRLDIYDGADLNLLSSIDVDAGRHEYMLTYREDKDLLYVGNIIFQVSNMTIQGRFPRGDRVVGYNSSNDRVFLTSTRMAGKKGLKEEFLHEYQGMVLEKDIIMPPIIDIPSSFVFAEKENNCFTGSFDSATIYKIGL